MSEKPSRNEEEYFAKQEAEILKHRREEAERSAQAAERRSHHMRCPKCGATLISEDYEGVQIDRCPECRGMWFDAGEAETLMKKEGTGIAAILRSVLKGVGAR